MSTKLLPALIMIVVLLAVGLMFWQAEVGETVWLAWLAALVAIPTQYGITNTVINGQASKHYQPGLAGRGPQPSVSGGTATGPPA